MCDPVSTASFSCAPPACLLTYRVRQLLASGPMGLDGGTLATRTDLLRRSSWRLANHDGGGQRSTRGGQLTATGGLHTVGVERRDASALARDGFSACALSGMRFPATPEAGDIVACSLGRLYLRTAVVEFLTKHGQFAPGMCDPEATEEACGHIRRLRDVFALTLLPSGGASAGAASDENAPHDRAAGMWRCPIDRDVSTNGQHAFAALRPCGCVLRERVAIELSRGARGGAGGAPPCDGISTIEGARWTCPLCSRPVEVRVRLMAAEVEANKVRETLRRQRADAAERKSGRKRERDAPTDGAGSSGAGSTSGQPQQ